jgi:hypothetical protein
MSFQEVSLAGSGIIPPNNNVWYPREEGACLSGLRLPSRPKKIWLISALQTQTTRSASQKEDCLGKT